MKNVWIIAKNTYREIIRDRVLYGLFVFAVLLIGLSLALGQLSFTEQARISIDFGFTAIHLSAVILSIFVGSTLVAREIEKKTILTLLVRPITRSQFIVGKGLGLIGVIAVSCALLAVVLSFILFMMKMPLKPTFFVALHGILLESIVLMAITIFFGTFASPMMAVSFSIGVFLIGHWLDSLKYFAEKSESDVFILFAKGISTIIPNLEFFNWRSLFVYGDPIPYKAVMFHSLFAAAWCAFALSVGALILDRRDLG